MAHTEIRCFSSVGRGANHQWTLWIAHNSVSEPSIATTSYMKPSITKVVTLMGSLDTRGGEDIIIVGNNFGILQLLGTVAHEQEMLLRLF